jgi:hypothetical protein
MSGASIRISSLRTERSRGVAGREARAAECPCGRGDLKERRDRHLRCCRGLKAECQCGSQSLASFVPRSGRNLHDPAFVRVVRQASNQRT